MREHRFIVHTPAFGGFYVTCPGCPGWQGQPEPIRPDAIRHYKIRHYPIFA